MNIQIIASLVITVFSILGTIITAITFINFMKFKIEILEKRLELLETKEIPNINAILASELKETRKAISTLEIIVIKLTHSLELQNEKFNNRLPEN